MTSLLRLPLALTLLAFSKALAAEVVYISEIDEFSVLAVCAASALTTVIDYQTQSDGNCGNGREEATNLQRCICSDTTLHEEVSSSIGYEVYEYCGRSATADRASASQILEKYCSPDYKIDFDLPTGAKGFDLMITDLPEMGWLAPCASSALGKAVLNETKCPDQASLYGPCVCDKPGVKYGIETSISRGIRDSCSNSADATSASEFFSQYCDLARGSLGESGFSSPGGPPGDMSYYITALSQFGSLRECAQTALSSAVQGQTSWRCPKGPQALASCVCLKTEMDSTVRRSFSDEIESKCGTAADDDYDAASDVWDFYCSAAGDMAVASVTESIAQTWPTGRWSIDEPSPSETDGAGNSGGTSDGGGVNKTAVIAGSVVGGVVAILAIIGAAFFIRRRKQKALKTGAAPSEPSESRELPGQHVDDVGVVPGKDVVADQAAEMSGEERRVEIHTYSEMDKRASFHRPQELEGSAVGLSHSPSPNHH